MICFIAVALQVSGYENAAMWLINLSGNDALRIARTRNGANKAAEEIPHFLDSNEMSAKNN